MERQIEQQEYGLTTDDMKRVDGWDAFDGLPVNVDEDELYRMAIQDYIVNEYMVGELTEVDPDKEERDIQSIYDWVQDSLFEEGICEFLKQNELASIEDHQILNNVDASFSALIAHQINNWLKQMPEERPMDILFKVVERAMLMGFIPSASWDHRNEKARYGARLFNDLQALYGEGFEGFYCEEVQDNETLETYYSKLQINAFDVLTLFFDRYMDYSYPINEQSLKCIVRQCMKLMFHVGYSYGLKYRNRDNLANELKLFSEEEMGGGVSFDFFDGFEDAYLYSMQVVSRLGDADFFKLSDEYYQQERGKDMYSLHSLPGQVLSYVQFKALGEMIGLRHHHNNHLYSFESVDVMVLSAFMEARKRFLEALSEGEYVSTDWLTACHIG